MPKNTGKFFNIKNLSEKEGEIQVYGEITKWAWKELGETNALLFNEELKKLKNVEKITVRINSPGGSVFEAQTMYNSLKQFAKDNEIVVETFIEGVAASAATFFALAGTTVRIGQGCLFMIHNPSMNACGMSEDLRKSADLLDKIKESIIDIYLKKTNLSREEVSQKMDEETWFSAEEALEAGFVDKIETFEDAQNKITDIANCSCLKEFKHIDRVTNFIQKEKIDNKKGVEKMPTLEELKNNHKELMDEHEKEVLATATQSDYISNIINSKVTEAVKNERTRIEELLNVRTINKKQEEAVKNAMFKEPKDPKDLIVEFYNSNSAKAAKEIEDLQNEAENNGTAEIEADKELNNKEIKQDIINAALNAFNDK